jgi:outer membrane murein-binding lipoprotein Lpp
MKSAALVVLIVLAGCASRDTVNRTALNASTVGPAFAAYSVEVADRDGNRTISREEWVAAGGSEKSFRKIDSDRNNMLTIAEITKAASTDRFLDFAKRTVDTGSNSDLTPRDFRSPAGAKLFSYQF